MVAILAMMSVCVFAKTKSFYVSEYKDLRYNAKNEAWKAAEEFANAREDEGYNTRIYFVGKDDDIVVVEYEKSISTTAKETTTSFVEKGKTLLGK